MNTPGHYPLAILQCPCCSGTLTTGNDTLTCRACRQDFPFTGNIPQLLPPHSRPTRLTGMDYDDYHDIDENSREAIGLNWATALPEGKLGDVLELGAGTGQLSWNLAHRFPLQSLHITDIAPSFIHSTAQLLGSTPSPTYYCICDANHLPFRDETFDTIVGNSVLHHFLDYPDILARLRRMLRPGGHAVFYEPILQGKIMVALLADIMLRTDRHTGLAGFDERDQQIIQRVIQHITKARDIGQDRERLAGMEDKYIFDLHEMQRLGEQLGYRAVTYQNSRQVHAGMRINLWPHLKMAGIAENKLAKYRFLLNAVKQTWIDMLPNDTVTPMGFFSFRN